MKRLEKLNELVKEELSKIILRDFDVPEGSLLTITRVETSDNKISAKVYITVLETSAGTEEKVLEELLKKTKKKQKSLNRALRIRPVP
ncbi:MAG: ribosome-binding factor A, partial [Candidatus Sungbacteria bacterium]|nr:ribosome-binding factor A [Candidatus Sungbacteria bacterium]